MLTPTVADNVQEFIAFGDTIANSLTRTLPQGVDAAILSLGCGDVRNILYTAYVEQSFPSRQLDFTCCDLIEHVHIRNVVFWSFIFDGLADDRRLEQLWDVYYHLYLDDAAFQFLADQVAKLMQAAGSFEAWRASSYGKHLRFCDHATFRDFQAGLAKYENAIARKATAGYADAFQSDLDKLDAVRELKLGIKAPTSKRFRSDAPVANAWADGGGRHGYYWTHGMTVGSQPDGSPPATRVPNPAFAVPMSDALTLESGAEPTLGYHLAVAMFKLADASPLKFASSAPGQVPEARNLVKAARAEFREMTKAFLAIRERVVIRFVTADALVFCHTVQNYLSSRTAGRPTSSGNWFRRQMDIRRLELDPVEYGLKQSSGSNDSNGSDFGLAPVTFHVIDTSDLADRFGILNLLVAGIPLLADTPSSALLTEMLVQRQTSTREIFRTLLCGDTPTVALLLGVAPVEYYTNARATSSLDEMAASSSLTSMTEGMVQLRSRCTWRLDHYFAGERGPRRKVHMSPMDLAAVFLSIYRDMYFDERDPRTVVEDLPHEAVLQYMNKSLHPHFHRGSLAALMAFIKDRVATDWAAACKTFTDMVSQDKALVLGSDFVQDFATHLHMWDVYTPPWITSAAKRSKAADSGVSAWDTIPDLVAVTLVVPRNGIAERLFNPAKKSTGARVLVGGVKSRKNTGRNSFHSRFADVQLFFGTVAPKGSRNSASFAVEVKEDPRGWQGSEPLIACFYVPTSTIQAAGRTDLVCLEINVNFDTVHAYGDDLDHMILFSCPVGDQSHVYVTKFLPNQEGYPVASASASMPASAEPALSQHIEDDHGVLTLAIDQPTGRASSITGHVNITSAEGKKLLGDKSVNIKLAKAPSPFAIDIEFGKRDLVHAVYFPVPVAHDTARLRVARKSSWIEVVAEIAVPTSTTSLEDFIWPVYPFPFNYGKLADKPSFVPTTLSGSHLNLDVLPILDVSSESKKYLGWLTTFASLMFSDRERQIRQEAQSDVKRNGISASPRVNFKESLFTIFMVSSGLQGGQTGLFAFSHPERGGIHMLLLVSALRFDGASESMALDAAVIPLSKAMLADNNLQAFLVLCRQLEVCELIVNDAELALWKKALPSLAERCRTWEHDPATCEYVHQNPPPPTGPSTNPRAATATGTIPLSLEPGEPVLCSCGQGKLPADFISVPLWEDAAPFATRVAISPLFPLPFAEDQSDNAAAGGGNRRLEPTESTPPLSSSSSSSSRPAPPAAGSSSSTEALLQSEDFQSWAKNVGTMDRLLQLQEQYKVGMCVLCGAKEAKGGGPLKSCGACKTAKYCSVECQKKDWRHHKRECGKEDEDW